MLLGIFVKSCYDLSKPENSESGDSWFGLGPPLVIGLGFLCSARVLMLHLARAEPGVLPPQARGRRPRAAGRERVMAGPIVVGYDGTDGAKAAVGEAIRLAPALGAAVVLAFAYGRTPAGGEVADLAAALRERGDALTGAALETLRGAGVEARAELVEGKPGEGLTELAERVGAQMIVVGSYGEKPLRGAILGSTPHRLLHLSERPVLVVRG